MSSSLREGFIPVTQAERDITLLIVSASNYRNNLAVIQYLYAITGDKNFSSMTDNDSSREHWCKHWSSKNSVFPL